MSIRGRIPIVDQFNPDAWGKDDITGLPVMHYDLIKQMEYIGTNLAWTGMMVHHKDADQPNPQLSPVRIPPDPVPIKFPRVLQFINLPAIPSRLTATVIAADSITIEWQPVTFITNYVVAWESNWSANQDLLVAGTPYTINNLAPGLTYLIQVASTNDNGQSAFCQSIRVTTI